MAGAGAEGQDAHCERLVEIASELDRLAEQLADVAMDILRDALSDRMADPDGDGSEAEAVATKAVNDRVKVINRARTAAGKGAMLARRAGGEARPVYDGW